MVPINKQIDFYSWQLKEIEKEWKAYYESKVETLIQLKECFLGEVYGFDESRGNVIVKFPKTKAPRLDTLFSFYYFEDRNLLNLSFKVFSKTIRTANGDNVQSLFHLHTDENFVFTAIGNVDVEIFEKLIEAKKKGLKYNVLIGKPEPPIYYLLRLRKFTELHQQALCIDNFKGSEISLNFFSNNKIDEIINHLEWNDRIIIQGPPGTGKSTLITQLLSSISRNHKICITASANKALIEVAKKIKDEEIQKIAYKTNITVNEKKEVPYLKSYDKNKILDQFILFTTYYKLSENIFDLNEHSYLYDYLIIEEASQAFYTTLVAFSQLAKKIIIIGDPMQLSPIVLNESNARNEIHLDIDILINGLETYMKKYTNDNYFLQNTYRLNNYNTYLTNLFYEGNLVSGNKNVLNLSVSEKYQSLFNINKPTQKWLQSSFSDKIDLVKWSEKFVELISEINTYDHTLEISILTALREDVSLLQEIFADSIQISKHNIIIETVDKVQGLTVDINFYLLRLNGSNKFLFNKKRFNVATSRSRFYNVIVIDKNYEFFTSTNSDEVKKYLYLL